MIDRETESRVRKAVRDGSPIQATDASQLLAELDELRAAYTADTIAVLRERERCAALARHIRDGVVWGHDPLALVEDAVRRIREGTL